MDKKILFIQNSNSFLINAIIENLENYEFECKKTRFDVDCISEQQTDFSTMFLFIEGDVMATDNATMVYLRDLCDSEDKTIFLMGDEVDVKAIYSFLGDKIVGDTFFRPVNARDVTDSIAGYYERSEKAGKKKSILVVDDSGVFLHTIKGWLDYKYKVAMVNSATSAISYLAKNIPDLVLLDYEMPICNGPMLLEMMRADMNLSSVPVIFLTGKGDTQSVRSVLGLKPQGYLLKSLSKEEVLDTIDNFFKKLELKMITEKNRR